MQHMALYPLKPFPFRSQVFILLMRIDFSKCSWEGRCKLYLKGVSLECSEWKLFFFFFFPSTLDTNNRMFLPGLLLWSRCLKASVFFPDMFSKASSCVVWSVCSRYRSKTVFLLLVSLSPEPCVVSTQVKEVLHEVACHVGHCCHPGSLRGCD